MLLVIDIGNTNIKMAVFDNDEIVMSLRLATVTGKKNAEYGFNVKELLHEGGIALSDLKRCLLHRQKPKLNYPF